MLAADQAIANRLCGNDTNVDNCDGSTSSNIFKIENSNVSVSKEFSRSPRNPSMLGHRNLIINEIYNPLLILLHRKKI